MQFFSPSVSLICSIETFVAISADALSLEEEEEDPPGPKST